MAVLLWGYTDGIMVGVGDGVVLCCGGMVVVGDVVFVLAWG